MTKEIIQGIALGLVAIIVVVAIGSFIAQAFSHGPKASHDGGGAAVEEPAQ